MKTIADHAIAKMIANANCDRKHDQKIAGFLESKSLKLEQAITIKSGEIKDEHSGC